VSSEELIDLLQVVIDQAFQVSNTVKYVTALNCVINLLLFWGISYFFVSVSFKYR